MVDRRIGPIVALWLASWSGFGLNPPAALAQPQGGAPVAVAPEYIVESPDLLGVTVWKHPELSGEFTIDPRGAIELPLVGTVNVAGLTVKQIEAEVTRLLADGFLRQPQVTVAVRAVRSKQVFVAGAVNQAGPIPLTGGLTVVEAITRAGALNATAGGEVIVVRRDAASRWQGPAFPGTPNAKEILRLDINELRAGRVSHDVPLEHGDTVFVTRAEVLFVHGQVNAPGSYAFEKGMTVLRALTLAGGPARLGAVNRIRVRRLVEGRLTDIRVELTDPVEPGDELFVPTRIF